MGEMIFQPTIEPHVHTRGFNQAYKETVRTASMAAIAGGVGTMFGMPNYDPISSRPDTWKKMRDVMSGAEGEGDPYCDVGFWATYVPGVSEPSAQKFISPYSVGAKYYIEPTQGNPEPVAVSSFADAGQSWHAGAKLTQPIAAHVEDPSVEEAIHLFAKSIGHPLYIPHINNRFLLETAIRAKQEGLPVYTAVTIDHLTMTEEAVARRGWLARMKPWLATEEDKEFILAHLDYVDVIETDHAPHTLDEKARADLLNPEGKTGTNEVTGEPHVTCFGTPNLEAVLPVLVTLIKNGVLTQEQVHQKTVTNPAKIFGITPPTNSYVKMVDDDYEFSRDQVFSKCGWNSFEGYHMKARVAEVVLRGTLVFKDGIFTDNAPIGQILNREK